MKLRCIVGDTEKHELEAEASLFGSKKVTVDGDDVIDKRSLSFSDTVRCVMGNEERHEVRVKFSTGVFERKIDIYVDGKLAAKT